MNISRRHLSLLLPALASAPAIAQTPAQKSAKSNVLPSKIYHTEQIAFTGDEKKTGRRFFLGTTHTGFNLEMHQTALAPGEISHPPHKHVNEEIIVITNGIIEVSIEGKTDLANAGSVVYFASNDLHNFKNIGPIEASYYVLELHNDAP